MAFRLPELRPRLPFTGLAIAAVVGIAAAELWRLPLRWPLAVAALLVIALWKWRHSALCLALVGTGFFTLHTLRHYESPARLLADEFAARPQVVTVRGIVWSDPEKPKSWSRSTTCHFLLKVEEIERGGVARLVDVRMNARWAGIPPEYGDRVRMRASVRALPPPTNPGEFDYAAYQRRQGVYSELHSRFATDCQIESSGHGRWAQIVALRVTSGIRRSLRLDLEDSPEISSLIESMLLGVHGDSLEETKLEFQRTGTMHLFAVSGLNIALLAIIAFFLVKPLGVRRRGAFFIILPALVIYALITGLSASCVRACVMAGLVLASYVVDRPSKPLNSVAAAAVLILAFDTEQFFSPGFQFSFALVLVLLGIATRLQRFVTPWGQPDPFLPRTLWSRSQQGRALAWQFFAGNMCVSIAAWFGSLLFTAGYFHLFSLSTVFANLIAVPLSACILMLGVASALTGWVFPSVAVLFNNANWAFAKLLVLFVKFCASLPASHNYVELPGFAEKPACEITVLDVGAGAADFIRTRDADWLLDCGHGYEYQRVVVPFLRSRGVDTLNGLILSHGDAQHIGAASEALADFRPSIVVDSAVKDRSPTRRKLHQELAATGRPKRICQRGDVLHLDRQTELRVLYPPAGLSRATADDKALVLLLTVQGTRVLFMSDAGFSTEQWLLSNEPELRADILVKGHHAKDLSATEDFLAVVQPRVVVASSASFGASNQKAEEWAKMVADRGITLFPQAETGAVTLELRERQFSVRGFVNHQSCVCSPLE